MYIYLFFITRIVITTTTAATTTVVVLILLCFTVFTVPFACRWFYKANAGIMKPFSGTLENNEQQNMTTLCILHFHHHRQSYRQTRFDCNNSKRVHLDRRRPHLSLRNDPRRKDLVEKNDEIYSIG